MTVAVRQEYQPDKLSLSVLNPSGKKARWAEDEPDSANVLSDLEPGDEMPGGDKDMTGTLARDPRRGWDDIEAYADLVLKLSSGEVIWEGFLDKAPDVSGDQMSITPAALGNQAILEDNACKIGIIDTDLSRYGDPSSERRKKMIESGSFAYSVETNVGFQDAGATPPGIFFTLGTTTASFNELGEQWAYYDGVDIGKILFDFISNTAEDATWVDEAFAATIDELEGGFDQSKNFKQKEALKQRVEVSAAGRKYGVFVSYYAGAAVGTFKNLHGWVNIKVLGNHGMEPEGEWPNIGYTSKRCLEYIGTFCKPLVFNPKNIENDGFLITQAWYGNTAPPSGAIKDVTKYGLWDWFVYREKEFEYRQPGSYGKFWKAFVAESGLEEVGLDSQRLWRYITVQYQDVNGSTKTVGPPGSGCNVETTSLEITDPEHPAVRAGRVRNDVLDLQGISNPKQAIEVGIRFLEEALLLSRSGSAALIGYVMDSAGVFHPAAKVKSGDWISFVDAADNSYRKIVSKKFANSGKTAAIEVDAPASGLEALLERLQAGLISLGVS